MADSVGKASFHFTDEGGYINYEAYDFATLTNGEQIPAEKYFEDVTYDMETRTFQGVIRWEPPLEYFPDSVMWKYTMIFSKDFHGIESGSILRFDEDNKFIKPTPDPPMTPEELLMTYKLYQ